MAFELDLGLFSVFVKLVLSCAIVKFNKTVDILDE